MTPSTATPGQFVYRPAEGAGVRHGATHTKAGAFGWAVNEPAVRREQPGTRSGRALPFRARQDLIVQRHAYQGRDYWVLKDPLTLHYHRFEDEEYALLTWLDGRRSLADLQREFELRFRPKRISLAELHRFVGQLHRSGLVVAETADQGTVLRQRRDEQRRRKFWSTVTNPLTLRFRGVDPDRFLTWLARSCGGAFSLPAVAVVLTLALAALLLIVARFDAFQARLPAFHEFFAAEKWVWLALTLGVTKVLHELGHGLACKRCGGECHELGLMLLVFMPCLYCNVSDSWMLPDKWRRAAISAAGMYVELGLAAVATFVWWWTAPGLLNHLCLSVMFVCSVSTLAVNANPLMRFDGYYILSDLLEIPNLRTKASAVLHRGLAAGLLGLQPPRDPFLPARHRGWFAAYAVAAAAYGLLTAVAIAWFLCGVLEPYGLKILGQLLGAATIGRLLWSPLQRAVAFCRVPGRWEKVKKLRAALSGLAIVASVTIGLTWPLPHHVVCRAEVQPRDAAAVYVETSGRLTRVHVRPGDTVVAQQPLATLENLDVALEIARLTAERQQLAAKLAGVRHRAFAEASAGPEIQELEAALAGLDERLAKRRPDLDRLTIRAPVAGTVLPAPRVAPSSDRGVRLASWSGSPFDAQNLDAVLESGTLLCRIGDPRQREVLLSIDPTDLEYVRRGQRVDLVVDEWPSRRITGRLDSLSPSAQVSPRSSSHGDQEPARPPEPTYPANVFLDDASDLLLGGTGTAHLHAAPASLAARLWRTVCRTWEFAGK